MQTQSAFKDLLGIFFQGLGAMLAFVISLGHFWEVSISTGIFGALCAWFVPQKSS